MSFQPEVGEKIQLFGRKYSFSSHPAVEGMEIPYGQEGRQGIVYQLASQQAIGTDRYAAFKVFRNRFKNEHQAELANNLQKYAAHCGLSSCSRSVVEQKNHEKLVSKHEDLEYSVIMPWIEGPTWADILLEDRALTKEESIHIACAFVCTMKEMEASRLAHCDLSSSNILIPYLSEHNGRKAFADVELVDIEELYAPDLQEPPALPGGSPGYAPEYVRNGVWSPDADRFAGAILLAEMATWYDAGIREQKADDVSYFDAAEIQGDSERCKQMARTLRNTLGREAESLFMRAWRSSSLSECPSFFEWFSVFPEEVKEAVTARMHAFLQTKKRTTAISPLMSVEALLEIASAFESLGNKTAAHREYAYIVSQFPQNKAVAEEISMLLPHDKTAIGEDEWDLHDYLEAASQFERAEDWEKALLFYERSSQLPHLDFSTKQEVEIITQEIRGKIQTSREGASTEEVLQKILDENSRSREGTVHVPPYAGRAKKQGGSFTQSLWNFAVKRWKLIAAAASILAAIGLGIWYYNYSAEKKWEELIRQGTEAFANRNYIQAEQFINQAIGRKPTEDLYTKLATIDISRGFYEEAIQYLEDLLFKKQLSDNNQEAHYLIGRSYFLMDDFSNATIHFEKAKKGQKSVYEQDVIRDLVVCYGRTNQYEKANQLVKQLKGSDAVSKAFISNLKGELFELQGKDSEAVEEFQKAVALEKGNERYVQNLVDLYIKKNRTNQIDDATKAKTYEEAIALINGLLKNDFTNVNYLNRLGQAYYDFGLYYEAKADSKSRNLYEQSLISYNQLIGLGIQNEDVLLNTGILYDKLNQKGKAEAMYKRVLAAYPRSGHVHFVYGLFYLKEKKYKDAVVMLQKVVQLNQNPSETAIAKERMKEMKDKKLI
ncbi:tetratricopeptide repeat protein [Aneurinibacillus tyrosinisolvens]|uniref:tetratricopeptide repeat protein n=1 Tax=Aneurinibacillus tyrosinisolvens TaxID=1443435 RepID=UPI00069B6202|nr:tetratricopeptide repeat protein [Aneurinibacillus tyrosinisolvens]